jgi:hypothetical protein
MSEHNLWTRTREGLKSVEAGIDLSRVENMVEAGMPDVNFCVGPGIEGWIELKWCEHVPKRFDTPVFKTGGLRDAQIVWIHKRVKRGGRVFIFCQVGEGLALLHGIYATKFNSMSLSELGRLARWKHAGAKPDWKEMIKALMVNA